MIDKLAIGTFGNGSYYIISNGECAIIDPKNRKEDYTGLLSNNNAVLKYIFHTAFLPEDHFPADHVKIIAGPDTITDKPVYAAKDEEEFIIGGYTLKVIHTPGFSINSCCILVYDADRSPLYLFTGKFLSQQKKSVQKKLAAAFFDALRMKIMSLPDNVVVKQADGTEEILGIVKEKNIYLRHKLSREEFIKMLGERKITFTSNKVKSNLKKVHSSQNNMQLGMNPLEPDAFRKTAIETGALILDTRSADEYMKRHIPGTLYIGLDESFASLAGALLPDPYTRILFIADEGREKDVIIRLTRMGFDLSIGYLEGGIEAWSKAGYPVESFTAISPAEFAELRNANPLNVVDVRKKSEYEPGHLIGATHLPLEELQDNAEKVSPSDPVYIYCVSGYRSVIACSILQLMGRKNVINVSNGFDAVCSSGLKKELIHRSPMSSSF